MAHIQYAPKGGWQRIKTKDIRAWAKRKKYKNTYFFRKNEQKMVITGYLIPQRHEFGSRTSVMGTRIGALFEKEKKKNFKNRKKIPLKLHQIACFLHLQSED